MFPPPKPPPAKPRGTALVFAIAIGVAVVATIAYLPSLMGDVGRDTHGKLTSDTAPFAYGEALGASLALAAVVWAVLFFGFVRQRNAARGALHFFVIWGLVAVIDVGALSLATTVGARNAARNTADQKATVQDLRAVIADMQRGDVGASANEISVTGAGDVGTLQALLKQELGDVAADHQAYLQELQSLGVGSALSAAALAHANLAQTEARLVQAQGVVAKYRALNDQRLATFRSAVEASAMTTQDKNDVLAGFDDSTNADYRRQVWDDEAAIVSDMVAAVGLLEQSRRAWRYQGGRLVFSNPAVLQAFNGKVTDIQVLSAQEKSVQAQQFQTQSTRLDAAANQLSQ